MRSRERLQRRLRRVLPSYLKDTCRENAVKVLTIEEFKCKYYKLVEDDRRWRKLKTTETSTNGTGGSS
jgi:hypothetical protein